MYYVTISTVSVGHFVRVNNHLVSGKAGYAGEIGDLIINSNRERVNYLNIGAVE